jgi:hypothetical protein
VLPEVERASSKKRGVLSIRVDGAPLPAELEYFLGSSHSLDASAGPVERVFPALVTAVRGQLGTAPIAEAHPEGVPDPGAFGAAPSATAPPTPARAGGRKTAPLAAAALISLAFAGLIVGRAWLHGTAQPTGSAPSAAAALLRNMNLPV